jgi:WD40 repeat protein
MDKSRHAILIANFSYDHLPNLTSPKYDAKELAELLNNKETGNYDCNLILDKTSSFIKNQIEKKLKIINNEDIFLLYYSGHGLKLGEHFYLTAKDTEYDSIFSTTISINDLSDIIQNCNAEKKIIILDCCYSGSVDIDKIRGKLFKEDIIVLTASSSSEKAYENNSGLSYFTKFLIEGIKTGDPVSIHVDDITIGEIHKYIQKNLEKYKPEQQASLNIKETGRQFSFVKNIKYIKRNKLVSTVNTMIKKSYSKYKTTTTIDIDENLLPSFIDLNTTNQSNPQAYMKNSLEKFLIKSQKKSTWNIYITGEFGAGKTISIFDYWSKIKTLAPKESIPFFIDLNKNFKLFFNNKINGEKKLKKNFLYNFLLSELFGNNNDINLCKILLSSPIINLDRSQTPSIILFLDHVDSIVEIVDNFFEELLEASEKMHAVQIVIVSRNHFTNNLNWNRYKVNNLTNDQINSYLRRSKINTEDLANVRKALKNPMSLLIYTNKHKYIYPDRENYAKCFDIFKSVKNLGELLWNFFEYLVYIKTLFVKDKIIYKYAIKYSLSYVANNMHTYNLNSISEIKLDKVLQDSISKINLNNYYKSFCVNRPEGCINCYKNDSHEYKTKDLLIKIKSIIIDEFGILTKKYDNYTFSKYFYQNFFSAVFIINDIWFVSPMKELPLSITKEPITYPVLKLLSEILHEYKTKNIQGRNNIIERLEDIIYTRKQKFNDTSYFIWNVIEIIKSVTGDISEMNLSSLNLQKINISNIYCYNLDKKKFTNFNNSIINEHFIIPNGHLSTINYIQLNDTQRIFASASTDKTIKIWHLESLECLKTLTDHTDSVNSVKFNTTNNTLISASSDNTIKIWSLENYALLKTLYAHTDSVNSIIISDDNKFMISASNDCTIKIWNLKTYACVMSLSGHKDSVKSICLTKDNKTLISASRDFSLKIWDLKSYKCIKTIEEFPNPVNNIELTSDNKRMITSSYKIIKIWDTKTWEQINYFWGHRQNVTSIRLNYNKNLLFSASRSSIIKIWSLKKTTWIKDINLYSDSIRFIELTKDSSRAIIGLSNGSIRVIDTKTSKTIKKIASVSTKIHSIAMIPNSLNLITTSDDGSIKILNLDKKHYLTKNINLYEAIEKLTIDCSGNYITVSSFSGIITTLDIDTLKPVNKFKTNPPSNLIALNINSKKLLTTYNNKINIWDLTTCRIEKNYKINNTYIDKIILYKDDKSAIISNEGNLIFFSFEESKIITVIKAHYMNINFITFDNSFKYFATASNDNTIKIWDFKSLKCIKTMLELSPVMNIAFNKNATQILSTSTNGYIKVWEIKTGNCINKIKKEKIVDKILLTPNNKYMIYTAKNKIYLWDYIHFNKITDFYNFSDININGCAFTDINCNPSIYNLNRIIKMYGGIF